ncbi:113aa long hypothetical protein [Pyrococcus horikoshii OT3]|uniref:Uncharacterized protein n=1 Tax=Pyrococcus horikoshii (strain ATCC 700860 / DSM 12428 / JCM 9974 / NBRC 100139 / OT-3) TaxID=70601 RepID=O58987_PYRHO|nr:113aa long hypothetical protein [Pyrococcus horikoshii OT3]
MSIFSGRGSRCFMFILLLLTLLSPAPVTKTKFLSMMSTITHFCPALLPAIITAILPTSIAGIHPTSFSFFDPASPTGSRWSIAALTIANTPSGDHFDVFIIKSYMDKSLMSIP